MPAPKSPKPESNWTKKQRGDRDVQLEVITGLGQHRFPSEIVEDANSNKEAFEEAERRLTKKGQLNAQTTIVRITVIFLGVVALLWLLGMIH